ncbi:MORC family CW-type zinc finger protein 3-like isoform X1 [Gadus macrocephalus]|uniref:MORC family CW-type zinc finger protein 3-like isoform X1 n=1 Tax=Gadus macrocephalus TaxID=80720 RepID=UPI0028CBC099|nr:MORC family CW-type zinc finger protein 3-like isoform X1 [Gadus macrocephalus]XP_059896068.1 MORC family CW-type zinc finger protein 3-like isoform X1 [Gadus macrocephalus]XP_059896069.1 MORC family CW-type zinc finger protein 3-like isoform X1 [Gadus macrocephalus]
MWENQASLRDILDHSPFNTEEKLLTELQAIEGPTGTRIIIWNLRRTSEGNMELDFTTENDIRIICNDSGTSVPEIHSSLRAYCSILYLRPSMQINIRGQKVEDRPIYESLDYIDRSYSYKPLTLEEKIPIIFGDNKSKEHYGLMMYHKKRLIKAYHRVTTQMTSIGIIGVIECNHLTPTPNKQDFDNDDAYRKTIKSVAEKLRNYSEKISKNVSDNNSNNNSDNKIVPIEEPNNERNDEDGESEEVKKKYVL